MHEARWEEKEKETRMNRWCSFRKTVPALRWRITVVTVTLSMHLPLVLIKRAWTVSSKINRGGPHSLYSFVALGPENLCKSLLAADIARILAEDLSPPTPLFPFPVQPYFRSQSPSTVILHLRFGWPWQNTNYIFWVLVLCVVKPGLNEVPHYILRPSLISFIPGSPMSALWVEIILSAEPVLLLGNLTLALRPHLWKTGSSWQWWPHLGHLRDLPSTCCSRPSISVSWISTRHMILNRVRRDQAL